MSGRPKSVAGAPAKEEDQKATKSKAPGKQYETRQQTLDGRVTKSVTFKDELQRRDKEMEEANKEFRNMMLAELGKIREESVELDKLKLEIKTREVEMYKRIESIEKKMESWVERERERIDRLDAIEGRLRLICGEIDGDTGSASSVTSGRTGASAYSVRTDGARSGISRASSVGLSDREVLKMKRMVSEQDRKERLANIVIRGVQLSSVDRLDTKKWVQDFIKDRLGVEIEAINSRINGKVIVVKLGSTEQKNAVMQNKSKLAGTNIYIEYDLSFEERQVQGEIHRWVKEKRENGLNVKSGNRRVCINGIWARWEELNRINHLVMEAEKVKGRSAASTAEKGNRSETSEGQDAVRAGVNRSHFLE